MNKLVVITAITFLAMSFHSTAQSASTWDGPFSLQDAKTKCLSKEVSKEASDCKIFKFEEVGKLSDLTIFSSRYSLHSKYDPESPNDEPYEGLEVFYAKAEAPDSLYKIASGDTSSGINVPDTPKIKTVQNHPLLLLDTSSGNDEFREDAYTVVNGNISPITIEEGKLPEGLPKNGRINTYPLDWETMTMSSPVWLPDDGHSSPSGGKVIERYRFTDPTHVTFVGSSYVQSNSSP